MDAPLSRTPRTATAALLLAAALLVAGPTAAAPAATSDTPSSTATAAATQTDAERTRAEKDAAAAERRAASSKFEREKLDPGAFGDDEASGSGDAARSDEGNGSVLRLILSLAAVVGAIYGLHYLLKRWGQSRLQGVAGRAGVIDVVATTALAQGRSLHLVRVGEELVLVGATDQSITRIGDVDATSLAQVAGDGGNGEFGGMLAGAMYGQQPGVPRGMGGAGSAQQPFIRRFLDNLRLSTAR